MTNVFHTIEKDDRIEGITFGTDERPMIGEGLYVGENRWAIYTADKAEPVWVSEPIDSIRDGWDQTISKGYEIFG